MTQNKMAAVRAVLSANPDAKPKDIVEALARQRIQISEGVASNYKSVIRSAAKRGKKGKRKARTIGAVATSPSNGATHSLDPSLRALLQAGKSLGWDKVKSIAELMTEK
jgi:hypothetical protein